MITRMKDMVEEAKKQLSDVLGQRCVSVTHAFEDERGWHLRVEVLEMPRVPSSTDVLGDYEVLLAADGSLVKFDRRRTRLRAESQAEDGVA